MEKRRNDLLGSLLASQVGDRNEGGKQVQLGVGIVVGTQDPKKHSKRHEIHVVFVFLLATKRYE